ncbi:MAG: 3'-5' exonuclease [Acidimicrobiia bacterium]
MTFPANIFASTINEVQKYDSDSILDNLNPSQKEAVIYDGGPLIVVAGAGSGKTRVLTRRIAYLISEKNISPYQILSITFTNKAASEMIERVGHLVGSIASRMWVSTFHSACARMLRFDGQSIGIKSGFTIYDVADATRLADYARRDIGADPKRFSAKSLHRSISSMKNELITPAQALEKADFDTTRTVAKIYAEYERRLRAANAVDFDDLLVKTVEMLKMDETVREKYQTRFQHVLVDEFQDTNLAQWELVNLIAEKNRNITVVGDADQSIYKFRGADHLNMERFEEKYNEARIVVLNTNYRSTENILNAANSVISNNTSRRKKELVSEKGNGEPITVYYASNDKSEAQFVAGSIAKLMDSHLLNEVAVFYRTNAQSRLIEEQLIRSGIAYKIIGGTKFFDRKEVKDALAYVRVFVNPSDEASWRRVINEPKRGIGDTSINKIAAFSRMYDITFREALQRPNEVGLSKKAASAAMSLCTLFDIAGNGELSKVSEVLEYLLENSLYKRTLETDGSFESEGRLENLVELISQAREFDIAFDEKISNQSNIDSNDDFELEDQTLIDPNSIIDRCIAFLEAVSLLSDSDQASENEESVTLMTLHTAKGLEFDVVFIVGLEEGLFPHERSMGDVTELEEERRLCYVGITRAKQRLFLSCALSRMVYATPDYYTPSRFLKEIPAHLVNAIEDKESVSDFSSRSKYSERNTFKSRYSQVYDEHEFNDLDPNDEMYSGHVIGGTRKKRPRDFATDAIIRSRIWGDSKSDEIDNEIDIVVEPTLELENDFDVSRFEAGSRVSHEKYGLGTVTNVEKHNNGDVAISVAFPADRTRTFMASLNPPLELV